MNAYEVKVYQISGRARIFTQRYDVMQNPARSDQGAGRRDVAEFAGRTFRLYAAPLVGATLEVLVIEKAEKGPTENSFRRSGLK